MKIETVNLTKDYIRPKSPKLSVLKGINITVNQGESVALTGPSGAGKSTLIHILGLMDKPTSGQIIIDGQDTSDYTNQMYAGMRRRNIGFVFQFHYLLSDFNVMENILMPVWKERKEKQKKAFELLELTGLKDRRNHMPYELSGGEQQRVALARALINNPKILFADEPTGNLDRETGRTIEKLMFDVCSEHKTTLVIVTHSSALAELADRQLKMTDGKIV